MASPKNGDVFYDLGCGTGKPVIAAALSFPKFKQCKGMELVDGLVQTGQRIASDCRKICKQEDLELAPVHVVCDDILKVDWSDGDIVFDDTDTDADAGAKADADRADGVSDDDDSDAQTRIHAGVCGGEHCRY